MFYKIKNWFQNYLKINYVTFFTMIILFIIGIIIGSISIKILNGEQKQQIINFFNSFLKILNNEDINSTELLKQSVLNNLKTIVLVWIMGILTIGVPIIGLIIIIRGFTLGFTVGFLINEFGGKGFLFSLLAVLPQNIFIIPGILFISSIGIGFSLNNSKNKKSIKMNNIKAVNFINYSIFVFLFSILIFCGSLIEAYITPVFLKLITEYI